MRDIDEAGWQATALLAYLDLPELGIQGLGVVNGIQPTTTIHPGTGRVVTATFAHASADVIDLVVEDTTGHTETIGVTSSHPFWSINRQQFIPAGELHDGERLRTLSGDTQRVVSKTARETGAAVYNLEVHGEHVYFVGDGGVLVHNNGCDVMVDTGVMRNFVAEGSSVRHAQKAYVGSRKMVAPQTAIDEIRSAMVRTGTIHEQLRANRLLSRITMVNDNPTPLFAAIPPSRKLGAEDLKIFGTADRLGIEILTTDGLFVRTFKNRTGHTIYSRVFPPY